MTFKVSERHVWDTLAHQVKSRITFEDWLEPRGTCCWFWNVYRFIHSPFRLATISYGVTEQYYAKNASYEIPD